MILAQSSALIAGDRPVDKGSFIIGGSTSLNEIYDSGDDSYDFGFLFEPEIQYFIIQGLAVGVDGYYDYYKYDDNSITQYGIGPSIAYYLSLKDPKGYPFARAAAIYHHYERSSYSGNDWNDFKFKGSVGYTYFIGRNVSIAGSLDYTYERYIFLDYDFLTTWRDVFGVSIGLKAFIY